MIDIGIKRELHPNEDGTFLLTVSPPSWSGFKPSSITLSADQASRFRLWVISGELIQDVFPDLPASSREIIMTGIDPIQWDEAFGKDE